jgi:heptosyltransferase-2
MKNKKLYLQKFLDRIFLAPIIFLLFFYKKTLSEKPLKKVKKIAIFKLDAIGDAVLSLPMIKNIKNRDNEIIVICSKENSAIFLDQEFISKVYSINTKNPLFSIIPLIKNLRMENIDLSIDTAQSSNISAIISFLVSKKTSGFFIKRRLRNKIYDFTTKINEKKHMVCNYIDLACPLNINIKKNDLVRIKYSNANLKKVKKIVSKNSIGIHPCTLMEYKSWPLKKWAQLIDKFLSSAERVVIVGSPSEKALVKDLLMLLKDKSQVINLTGELNLKELAATMTLFKLFIANDGGSMHISAAMGTKTLGLFGPETPIKYAPFNKKSKSIYHPEKCSPCIKEKNYLKCSFCNSLDNISVDEVFLVSKKMLEKL